MGGVKRKASEMQHAAVHNVPTNTAPVVSVAPAVAAPAVAGEGAEGGGGATGELDEEEEPSSSSSTSSSLGNPTLGLHCPKRFKRATSLDGEQVLDSAGSDLTEAEPKSPRAEGNEVQTQSSERPKMNEYARLSSGQLQEAQKVAASRGGVCLSKVTIKAGNVLAFQCRFGHIFQSTAENAKTSWCLTCRKYFVQCLDWAREHGGRYLDEELSTPVHFECGKGHRFVCVNYTSYFSAAFVARSCGGVRPARSSTRMRS
jgi:hypothetical protein